MVIWPTVGEPNGGETSCGAGAQVIRQIEQTEIWDLQGRVVREGATIYVVACNGSRRQIYIYLYCDQPDFRLGFERTLAYVTGLANVRDAIPFPRTPGNAKY